VKFIDVGRLLSERAVEYDIFNIFNEELNSDLPVTDESFHTVKTIYYDTLLQNFLINQFVYDVGVGSLAFMSGQTDIAIGYLLKAQTSENQMHHNDNDEILLLLYDTLGNAYREKYEYDLALRCYSTSLKIDSTQQRLDNQASIYKILGHYEHALTSSSTFTCIARACDKRKDSMTNVKEWKVFVDYAAENNNYLSRYHAEIIKEYLEIGKIHAGISSKVPLYNNGNYRLKGYEIPRFPNDVLIDPATLQVAIECFQHVLDICNRLDVVDKSRNISTANEYIALTNDKISKFSV
jgi:tetratricopeptide (TPR) repeat protein